MKYIWLLTIMFGLLSVTSFAKDQDEELVSLKTVVTCWQEDGDVWVEVGIVDYGREMGLRAFVVEHNEDNGAAKLVLERVVTSKKRGKKTVYRDAQNTLSLIVSKPKGAKDLRGDLSVDPADTLGDVSPTGLYCLKNNLIGFERGDW